MKTSRSGTSKAPAYDVEVSGKRLGRQQRTRLIDAIETALQREGCAKAVVSVAVVDDATMANLHATYSGIPGPTDVLSFDLGDNAAGEVDGEVVISQDTARREAGRRRIPVSRELLRYAIHGTLHLLGYLDDRPERAKTMHRIEDEVLAALDAGRKGDEGSRKPLRRSGKTKRKSNGSGVPS